VAHKGQKPSDETRAKMSAKKLSPEHIAALIAANTGRHPSEETRGKLRAWQIGKTISEEQRAKISATLKGRKISPECLRKRIGQKRSPEVKARMTEGQLRRYEVARLAA
jgi:hypothetical protein